MVSIPKEVMDILSGPREPTTYKAIVTVNDEGIPNIAPMGSISAMNPETIIFGDMSPTPTKTRANLEGKNKKVVIALWKPPAGAYQVKGTFTGFQTSGPLFENFVKAITEAATKTGRKITVTALGVVKVDEVYSSMPAKKLA